MVTTQSPFRVGDVPGHLVRPAAAYVAPAPTSGTCALTISPSPEVPQIRRMDVSKARRYAMGSRSDCGRHFRDWCEVRPRRYSPAL